MASIGFAEESFEDVLVSQSSSHFVLLTFPKAGLGLTKKLFAMMSKEFGYKEAENYYFDHFYSHTNLPEGINPKIDQLIKEVPTVIVVRDFRDILVSLIHWVDKRIDKGHLMNPNMTYSWVPEKILHEWMQFSFFQKMEHLIQGGFHPEVLHFGDEFLKECKNMKYYLPRVKFPCIVKFENLIGPKGGGSLETQKNEIRKIAGSIGISLSTKELDYLCDNLFGIRNVDKGTGYDITFRKGQTGDWKQSFNSYTVGLFKEKYNETLLQFEYETIDNWKLEKE